MELLVLLLLVVGAVCFGLAAFGVSAHRLNLVALGLLCWIATAILPALYRV